MHVCRYQVISIVLHTIFADKSMYNALEDIVLAILIPVYCIFNIQYKHYQIKIFGGPERFEAVTRMSQFKILCTISTIADRENVWRTSLILNRNWVIEKFHIFVKTITCNCYFTDLASQIVSGNLSGSCQEFYLYSNITLDRQTFITQS